MLRQHFRRGAQLYLILRQASHLRCHVRIDDSSIGHLDVLHVVEQ